MSEVSNRRFVHFDGTKQEFIDGGYDEMYSNSIVFINEKDANNRLIYTHGEYYGVIVDNYLNEYSTNAIRNKTVYNEIENLRDEYYTQLTLQIANTTIAKGEAESSAKLLNAGNKSTGIYSVSLGKGSSASGEASFACGNSVASGAFSHSEGGVSTDTNGVIRYTKAIGHSSHAEGAGSHASGYASHAEGEYTTANNNRTHAEGYNTLASGRNSHAEGEESIAQGQNSHSEGYGTQAIGNISHAEGRGCIANGRASHATGWYTVTTNEAEFACGKYNNSRKYTIFSVGYGTNENNRASLFEIRSNGNYSDETHNGTAYFKSGIDIRGHQYDAEVGRMGHNYALTCTSAKIDTIKIVEDLSFNTSIVCGSSSPDSFGLSYYYNDDNVVYDLSHSNVVLCQYINLLNFNYACINLAGLKNNNIYTLYIPLGLDLQEGPAIHIILKDNDTYWSTNGNTTKSISIDNYREHANVCMSLTLLTRKEAYNSNNCIVNILKKDIVEYFSDLNGVYDLILYYHVEIVNGYSLKISIDIIQTKYQYKSSNLYMNVVTDYNGYTEFEYDYGYNNYHNEMEYGYYVDVQTDYMWNISPDSISVNFNIVGLTPFSEPYNVTDMDLFQEDNNEIYKLKVVRE